MKYRKVIAALVGCILSATASASLVYDSTIHVSGQGFGVVPRDLTLQATGQNSTTESGCVGVDSGGVIAFGTSCVSDPGSVFMGNLIMNQSGTGDLPNPLADNQKYGIPTIGSLGITTATQIAILFNADEPGGDSAFVTDLTLKFYSATGTLLGAIDGQQNFLSTDPGNGVAGFVFVVDLAQLAYVNGLLATGGPGTTLALESTITNVAGGPESFVIYNRQGGGGTIVEIPEPGTLALLGIALLGGLAASRKRLGRNGQAT